MLFIIVTFCECVCFFLCASVFICFRLWAICITTCCFYVLFVFVCFLSFLQFNWVDRS